MDKNANQVRIIFENVITASANDNARLIRTDCTNLLEWNDSTSIFKIIHGNCIKKTIDWKFFIERSEEHTSELQSRFDLVCRLLPDKNNPIHTRCLRHRARHRP